METGTKIGRLTKSSFFENLADEDRSLKNNLVTLTWSSLLLLVTNRMNNVFFFVAEVRDFFLREVKKRNFTSWHRKTWLRSHRAFDSN